MPVKGLPLLIAQPIALNVHIIWKPISPGCNSFTRCHLRLILILPDREKGTISKGHLFRPRYLTYADGDFLDVAAVLAKMIDHARSLSPLGTVHGGAIGTGT